MMEPPSGSTALCGLPPQLTRCGSSGRNQRIMSSRSARNTASTPLAMAACGAHSGKSSGRWSPWKISSPPRARSQAARRSTSASGGAMPSVSTRPCRTTAAPVQPKSEAMVTEPAVRAEETSSASAICASRSESRPESARRASSAIIRSAPPIRSAKASVSAAAAARWPGEGRCGCRWWHTTNPHNCPSCRMERDMDPSTPMFR